MTENKPSARPSSTSRGGTFSDMAAGTCRNQYDVRHALQQQEAAKTPTERLIDANIARHRAQQAEAQQREAAKAAQQQRDCEARDAQEAAETERQKRLSAFRTKEHFINTTLDSYGLSQSERQQIVSRLAAMGKGGIHNVVACQMFCEELTLKRGK